MVSLTVRHWISTLVLSCFLLISGCASKPTAIDLDSVPLYDLSQDKFALEKLSQFSDGSWDGSPFAFKIPSGYELPIHISVDTPIAQLDSSAGNLVFSHDVFFYLEGDQQFASPDGVQWAPCNEIDLLKELFKGDKGSLAIGMSAKEHEQTTLSIKLVLTRKK